MNKLCLLCNNEFKYSSDAISAYAKCFYCSSDKILICKTHIESSQIDFLFLKYSDNDYCNAKYFIRTNDFITFKVISRTSNNIIFKMENPTTLKLLNKLEMIIALQ